MLWTWWRIWPCCRVYLFCNYLHAKWEWELQWTNQVPVVVYFWVTTKLIWIDYLKAKTFFFFFLLFFLCLISFLLLLSIQLLNSIRPQKQKGTNFWHNDKVSVRIVHLTVVSTLNCQEPGECTCVCQLNLLASASNNRNWDKQIICIYHRLPSCQYVVWEKTFAPRMCPHFVLSCYNVSTFCVVLLKCVHVLCYPAKMCPRFVLSC